VGAQVVHCADCAAQSSTRKSLHASVVDELHRN